jgi:nicotinamide riboside transporter PnuC
VASALGTLNGVALAYAMGLINAGMALIISFGVNLNTTQQAAIFAFVNAALVLVAHVSHNAAKRTKEVIPAPPIDESQRV